METNAGMGVGIGDKNYRHVDAEIVATAEEIFARAEMIVKVKEPQSNECKLMRQGQILFTLLVISNKSFKIILSNLTCTQIDLHWARYILTCPM